MRFELAEDWKTVLTKAWSVRFGFMGALFAVLNALMELGLVLPYLQDYVAPKTFLVLALLSGVAGFVSRFLKQKGFDDADADPPTTA